MSLQRFCEILGIAIRYFAYYLATSILGRENTSNISKYHLAFLDAALNNSTKYNPGALIARRLSARGPIYGGIIDARIVASLGLSVDPNDVLLAPQRLDLHAMKLHKFVTAESYAGNLVYKMLFIDDSERRVPLPQQDLLSIGRKPWSRSKEELDEQLRTLGFHGQHPGLFNDSYNMHYPGAPSSSYQDDGASSSHYGGGATQWPTWD